MSSSEPDTAKLRDSLIKSLKGQGILQSRIIEEALLKVPREEFLWEGDPKYIAYFDEPQTLGDTCQTMSAPHMIVIMLEKLELSPGLKILEIGTGSGYNAALLGYIVSGGMKEAKELVLSIERNERLVEFARRNIEKVGLSEVVNVVPGDGSLGYPQGSNQQIYDRIVVTAGSPKVPIFLKKQLKLGGILEIPVGRAGFQDLLKLRKVGEQELEEEKIIECMFVPLVGEDAY